MKAFPHVDEMKTGLSKFAAFVSDFSSKFVLPENHGSVEDTSECENHGEVIKSDAIEQYLKSRGYMKSSEAGEDDVQPDLAEVFVDDALN